MQVALRANLLSRLIKAPVRLGWDRARSRDRHHWFINHEVAAAPFQHQVQGFLQFPRALGIDVGKPVWNLPVTETDRDWAAQTLPGEQPHPGHQSLFQPHIAQLVGQALCADRRPRGR